MKLDEVRRNADEGACATTVEAVKQHISQPASDLDRSVHTSTLTSKPADRKNPRSEAMTPTAGSWVAARQSKQAISDCDLDDEKVARKACSILNKLTVEKFDSLVEQLVTCGISKPEHLELLMREVFNKAATQHHFIVMYVDLCVRLEQDKRISSVVETAGQQYSFRWLLVNQCQTSFEKLLQPASSEQLSKDAEMDEEYASKCKEQALGTIKLIGQLVVHRMVTSNVLVECSERLLRCRDSCPKALEYLAALLTVAGKQFDTESWQYHPRLLEVFSCMRKLSKDKSIQARDRFLLRDVMDVRDAGWPNCANFKATLTTPPMKLDEVRQSAAHQAKYMNLEEQVETDNLLTGLIRLSKVANGGGKNAKEESSTSSEGTQTHSKPRRQKTSRQHRPFGKVVPLADLADDELTPSKPTSRVAPKEKTQESSPPRTSKFDVMSFRRALVAILADLEVDRKAPAAVSRVLSEEVPIKFQAQEFADIITRVVEERRGPIRRCAFTFATGLASAEEQNAFDRGACLNGIGQFFHDVYPALCKELPRLPAIVTKELLPTLRSVFSEAEIKRRLPEELSSTDAFQQALTAHRPLAKSMV